jgi:two-component system LytT family response regulator
LDLYAKNRIEVLEVCSSIEAGYEALMSHDPDVVFLDIRMPRGTGFDLLEQAKSIKTEVIFVTAYEEYSMHAFEINALGYLVKPIDPEKLVKAINKLETVVIGKRAETMAGKQLGKLPGDERISIQDFQGFHILKINDIAVCDADNNYTNIILSDGSRINATLKLKELEGMLPVAAFFRIHMSNLINLNFVKRLIKRDRTTFDVEMINGEIRAVSRRRRDQLIELLA